MRSTEVVVILAQIDFEDAPLLSTSSSSIVDIVISLVVVDCLAELFRALGAEDRGTSGHMEIMLVRSPKEAYESYANHKD
jgi:hypothetical protein